jgi:signal transduction histidine kinase
MLRRIEAINRTSRDIIAGDLTRRIPVSGSSDELDRLAGNLNTMLDQIEGLMTGMRQVTDNIAHDLRSPLTRIRTRLELALMERPSVEAYRAAMEQVLDSTTELIATFNALLSIAQVEAGALRESMAEIDLAAVAEDVAELYAPVAEDAQLRLRIEAAGGTLIRGNRHLLSQALANLIDNAIKHTPAGGTISVRVARADGSAELVVEDTGPGIPESDRTRVLDRFVRLEASRHAPGSGLGLSLVRAVAQLHHGTLTLEDNRPGLRVRLVFPAMSPTGTAPDATS